MTANTMSIRNPELGPSESDHPFLQMLPQVQRCAGRAFAHWPPEAREEAVQETVANAFVAYTGLAERGREHLASPWSLSRYAIKQFHAGRRVGKRMNRRDVMAEGTIRACAAQVHRYEYGDLWQALIGWDTGRRCGTPADLAAFRIDFSNWLGTLPARHRRLAYLLARGEQARQVARDLGLTPARVTQIRQALRDRWNRFHGDAAFAWA